MDLVINPKSGTPIYEQIYRTISAQILNGALAPDECLPSIRTVAREIGVSVITVKNAYERLEREGYIYTQAGRGCFVGAHSETRLEDKRLRVAQEKLSRAIEDCTALGLSKNEISDLFKKTIG